MCLAGQRKERMTGKMPVLLIVAEANEFKVCVFPDADRCESLTDLAKQSTNYALFLNSGIQPC
jgi:hypothetical protein